MLPTKVRTSWSRTKFSRSNQFGITFYQSRKINKLCEEFWSFSNECCKECWGSKVYSGKNFSQTLGHLARTRLHQIGRQAMQTGNYFSYFTDESIWKLEKVSLTRWREQREHFSQRKRTENRILDRQPIYAAISDETQMLITQKQCSSDNAHHQTAISDHEFAVVLR